MHSILVANTVVLLAVILPAVASLPLEWLLQYPPLGFTGRDSWLSVVILTVLALADVLVASLGISEADAVHLLALALRASTLP